MALLADFLSKLSPMNIGFLLSLLFLLTGIPNSRQVTGNTAIGSTDLPADTPFLKPSFKVEDDALPVEEKELYGTARADYKRINSINRWTSVISRDVTRALEGGEAYFYFTGTRLEKIIVRDYGETYQQLTEYYLRNSQLSFVVEERATYNVPFYIDSAVAVAAGETEFFDIQKSDISETRSYFERGLLRYQVSNHECGALNAASFVREEERRFAKEFASLLKKVKEK